ncbi:MAG: ribonuclease HI family protein [Novosphingobium sp.]
MTRHDSDTCSTFFFDGGCRPNPGPMEVAVVSRGEAHFRDDIGSGDNNEAEWTALLFAVELAVAARVADAIFVGDSMVVVEQARGRWRCRSPHLQPYLTAYQTAAAAIPRVRLRHVPRSKNLAGIALARRGLP